MKGRSIKHAHNDVPVMDKGKQPAMGGASVGLTNTVLVSFTRTERDNRKGVPVTHILTGDPTPDYWQRRENPGAPEGDRRYKNGREIRGTKK